MRVAVASGKGGTGKTTLAVGLALSLAGDRGRGSDSGGDGRPSPLLLDCDVEAPDADLFLHPEADRTVAATVPVPEIDHDLCILCGDCVDVCAFQALAILGGEVRLFAEMETVGMPGSFCGARGNAMTEGDGSVDSGKLVDPGPGEASLRLEIRSDGRVIIDDDETAPDLLAPNFSYTGTVAGPEDGLPLEAGRYRLALELTLTAEAPVGAGPGQLGRIGQGTAAIRLRPRAGAAPPGTGCRHAAGGRIALVPACREASPVPTVEPWRSPSRAGHLGRAARYPSVQHVRTH